MYTLSHDSTFLLKKRHKSLTSPRYLLSFKSLWHEFRQAKNWESINYKVGSFHSASWKTIGQSPERNICLASLTAKRADEQHVQMTWLDSADAIGSLREGRRGMRKKHKHHTAALACIVSIQTMLQTKLQSGYFQTSLFIWLVYFKVVC